MATLDANTTQSKTQTHNINGLTEPLLPSSPNDDEEEREIPEESSNTNNTQNVEADQVVVSDEDYFLMVPTTEQEGSDADAACHATTTTTSTLNYPLDPQRYAVLGWFSLCNLLASAEWITFAPIEDAVRVRYGGISAQQVNWLSMIFMLVYGPGTALCSWSIRRFGLRHTVVVSAVAMAMGSVLRWWSIYLVHNSNNNDSDSNNNNNTFAYTLLLTGQGIVAMGQPVFANAPARVACAWFQQTTQAIGVTVFAAMLGMVLGQAMSPMLVQEATGTHLGDLLAGQAVAMVVCAMGTWWFFQSEPKHPPTAAEAAKRRRQQLSQPQQPPVEVEEEEIMQGEVTLASLSPTMPTPPPQSSSSSSLSQVWTDVGTLITDPQYIVLLISFGIGYGVNNAMLTVLQPWVAAAGFPGDETAGLLGSLNILGGVVGTVIAAPLLDASRRYKQAVKWSYGISFLISVATVGVMRPACPDWILAVAFFLLGMVQYPILPICLDAAAAHTYPIAEELSSAGLQLGGQYLGILMINTMGKLLENNQTSIGYSGAFNLVFLMLLSISTAVALLYNGEDARAAVNNNSTSTNNGGGNNDEEENNEMLATNDINNRPTASGPTRKCRALMSSVLLLLNNTPSASSTSTSSSNVLAFQPQHRHLRNQHNKRTLPFAATHRHNDESARNPMDDKIPQHVAFICDGNSRWAQARGLPASVGHAAGADQLVKILQALKADGVQYCTLYAFSTENWNRPAREIQNLLRLMEESCHRFHDYLIREKVQFKAIGDLQDERIPNSLRKALWKLEQDTAQPSTSERTMMVCLALNYGGRKDILSASLKMANLIQEQKLDPDEVTEETLASLLSTSGIPDPELIIRTSGECRLSNFMLWNAAYAELYFTPTLWPDFDGTCWQQALDWYSNRQRNFGARQILNMTISP